MNDKASMPITLEGKQKLVAELERLTTQGRGEIARKLKEAIAHGDLRENAGYEEAKNAQALLEYRIQELTNDLANCVVIDVAQAPTGVVSLGNKVVIREEGTVLEETYFVVGKSETDPASGRISNQSPLGKAMLGQRVGSVFTFETPAGRLKFRILSVEAA